MNHLFTSLLALFFIQQVWSQEWLAVYRSIERDSYIPVKGINSSTSNIISTAYFDTYSRISSIFTAGDEAIVVIISDSYSAYPTGNQAVVYSSSSLSKLWSFTAFDDSLFAVAPSENGNITICAIDNDNSGAIKCSTNGQEFNFSWNFTQAGSTPSLVFINSTTLLISNDDDGKQNPMYLCVSIIDGSILWNSSNFLNRPTNVNIYNGYTYFTANSKNNIAYAAASNITKGIIAVSINLINGISLSLWSYFIPNVYNIGVTQIIAGDNLVIYEVLESATQAYVYCNDAITGYFLWSINFPEMVEGIAYSQNLSVLAVTTATNIYYYNVTGKPIEMWSKIGFASCPFASDVQATIDIDGNVYVCNCSHVLGISMSGNIFFSQENACITQPILGPDGSIIYSASNILYQITKDTSPHFTTTTSTTGNRQKEEINELIRKWWFWTAIGGGVVVIVIISALFIASRNRRRKQYQSI